MIKIIKNNTANDVSIADTGITIPASGQYTIAPQDYNLWAASDHVVTFIDAGTLTVNDGNIDFYKDAGIAYLRLEERVRNIVYVSQNPGYADFSSIADAVASITTASSTDQFLVLVGPGTYVEPQIVMKPFVSIQGVEIQSVIITPSDPTNHLIIGAAATLRFCTIKGVTTAGKAGVYNTASGFQLRNCVIRDNPINILVEGIASLASITADTLIVTGVFDVGIQLKNSGAGVQGVFMNSIFNAATANSGAKCGVCQGASVSFIFSGLIASGASTTNCLSVFDGATLKVLAQEVRGFSKAIWVENIGAAPTVDILSINCDNNTTDVQIDHTSANGVISGILTRSKVNNASPNGIQLNYTDPITGDMNITRILATRGFATDVTNLTTFAGVHQLVSFDAHTVVTSGSTEGTIIRLPDATTLRIGHLFWILNTASVNVTVQHYGGSGDVVLTQNTGVRYVLKDNSTSAGIWVRETNSSINTGGGTTQHTFSKSGGTGVGAYLKVGEVVTDKAGQIIRGLNFITQISCTSSALVSGTGGAVIQLQRRTGLNTFVDISGATVTVPDGSFSASNLELLVPIGPDWEISCYNSGPRNLTDAVVTMFIVPQ